MKIIDIRAGKNRDKQNSSLNRARKQREYYLITPGRCYWCGRANLYPKLLPVTSRFCSESCKTSELEFRDDVQIADLHAFEKRKEKERKKRLKSIHLLPLNHTEA